MTDDFDFDFDVNRDGSSSGTRSASRPDAGEERSSSNGSEGAPDPLDKLDRELERLGDLDGPAERVERRPEPGNGASDHRPGALERGRDALRRAGRMIDGDEAPAEPNGSNAAPPRPNGGTPAAPRRERARKRRRRMRPDRVEERVGGDEDWLSLTDDDLGRADLDSIAEADDGPAGPPTPAEGRALARSARRRATGREAIDGDDDFEALLERQPQKSEVAKRGSAIVYGLRGLLDDGRERLRGGAQALRGGTAAVRGGRGRLSALRERIPSTIQGPAPSEGGAPPPPQLPKRLGSRRPRKPQPGRIKKLRLAIIAIGIIALAMVSTVFGMMMAVAGDLPQLENEAQYKAAQNSEVFDAEGRKIGTLLSNTQRRLIESEDISPYVKQAVVAIEDERFYEHRGVDFKGIARAVVADLMPGGSTQGASTITQQFVKNALEAQGERTYFQKLREAAYAYHLERQWDKDKILTQYLNTIYFGEGAYGIESAARTYFGKQHPECLAEGADPCAGELGPEEAALLAGIISAPSAASPRANPEGAPERRNLVLQKMAEQGYLAEEEFEDAAAKALPAASDIQKPEEDSLSPYFTSWLRQQLVDRYGAGRAFSGGLDVHTTLDLDMQQTAERIAYDTLAGIEPTASLVVLENSTGAVKAMVGGNDFEEEPFNLATNGQRQPGSAFKPFVLAAYLANGGSSGDTFSSEEKTFIVPNSAGKEKFTVKNYEEKYFGSASVATATKYSDNSVFAAMGLGNPPGRGGPLGGIKKGPGRIARLAQSMGIQNKVDAVPAITLGAPSIGFTPLEMTYAMNSIALDGKRVGGTLDSIPGNRELSQLGPVGMTKIVAPDGEVLEKNEVKTQRALPESVADTVKDLLHGPVSSGGTGSRAQTPGDEWGKTGTTENNGDAWFCGGTEHLTACVWVGHAKNNTPMETEFGGEPVDGGTYPALIWGSIMSRLQEIYEQLLEEREAAKEDEDEESEEPAPSSPAPSSGGGSVGSDSGSGGGSGGGGSQQSAPAPSGGGGGGSGGGIGAGL